MIEITKKKNIISATEILLNHNLNTNYIQIIKILFKSRNKMHNIFFHIINFLKLISSVPTTDTITLYYFNSKRLSL